MSKTKEDLLEELEAVKHFVTMTEDNISHDKTQQEIIAVLDNRIAELQKEIEIWDMPITRRFIYYYLGIEP